MSAAERLAEIAEFTRYLGTVWPSAREGALASLSQRCGRCILSERHSPLSEGLCAQCRACRGSGSPVARPEGEADAPPREPLTTERGLLEQGGPHGGDLAQALDEVLQQHQGKAEGWHDALVMFSGGKDSTLLLHTLQQRFPRLRLLAVMIDNGFTSSVAAANAQRVAGMLQDVDYCTLTPRHSLYETTFRHALTHLDGEGSYASVERLAGDLNIDLCRNLAASRGIPLVIHGGTREQVERNLGVTGFEIPRALERVRRVQVDRFVLAQIYGERELAYWWDGTRWPEHAIPRILFPFCAWPYDEAHIRREVVRLSYFLPGNEDPLASNSDLLPVNLALDVQRLGYTSYEPDFARLVREGKADRTSLLLLFQAIEHLARGGAFLPRCITDTLRRLRLSHEQLGLPVPEQDSQTGLRPSGARPPCSTCCAGAARAPAQQPSENNPARGPLAMTQPSEAEMDEFVRQGGMAPSGGNAQPWRVALKPGALELHLEPGRTGSFLDVEGTASRFAAGCFIENVCLAAAAGGWRADVAASPEGNPSEALVTLRFSRSDPAPRDPLVDQIPRRHTNRRLHEGPPIEPLVIEQLRQALGQHDEVRLVAVTDPAKKREAAAHLGVGEAILLQHSQLFSDMLSELRWTRVEAERTRDGVALSTLELPAAAVGLLHALRKWPGLRRLLPRPALKKMPEPLLLGSSHLCVVPLRGAPSTQALIGAGRAVQRVWLRATELGLAVQPLAALPFMLLRATHFGGAGFSPEECRELQDAGAGLQVLLGLSADELPLFIFRLSRAAAASDRALRLPHRQLYLST